MFSKVERSEFMSKVETYIKSYGDKKLFPLEEIKDITSLCTILSTLTGHIIMIDDEVSEENTRLVYRSILPIFKTINLPTYADKSIIQSLRQDICGNFGSINDDFTFAHCYKREIVKFLIVLLFVLNKYRSSITDVQVVSMLDRLESVVDELDRINT